jgi:predicted 2-oxoglutarate/Fe(II)-dependent dioxygenase YbiX
LRVFELEKVLGKTNKKIQMKKMRDTQQAWDKRTLGAEAQFVAVADSQHELNLNKALGLSSPQDNQMRATKYGQQPTLTPSPKAS